VPREPLWRFAHVLAGRNVRELGNTPGHINHWSSSALKRLVARHGTVERSWKPVPWTAVVVDVRGADQARR
jgi:hypothetical protein